MLNNAFVLSLLLNYSFKMMAEKKRYKELIESVQADLLDNEYRTMEEFWERFKGWEAVSY